MPWSLKAIVSKRVCKDSVNPSSSAVDRINSGVGVDERKTRSAAIMERPLSVITFSTRIAKADNATTQATMRVSEAIIGHS